MDKEFLAQQKKKLETEKEETEKELKNIVDGGEISNHMRVKYPQLGFTEEDNAEEAETYMENLDIESYLEDILKNINSALVRIEKGNYGTCQKCGKEIDKARLEAYPVATLCLEDQKDQETDRSARVS